jgi:hypothetical protein
MPGHDRLEYAAVCKADTRTAWSRPAAEVSALLEFEHRLQQAIALLDSLIPADADYAAACAQAMIGNWTPTAA